MPGLSSTQRQFLRQIGEAAFANPFGRDRHEIDARAAALPDSAARDAVIDALLVRLSEELARLPSQRVDAYSGGDRAILEHAVLFDVFHSFSSDFDELISRQAAAGIDAVSCPFGGTCVRALVQRGFAPERAERLLGVLYQVRRAFYFISRTLIGRSGAMRHVRERLWENVFTHDIVRYEAVLWDRMEDFSSFFVGETGTGKGTAAAAVGRSGWIGWNAGRGRFDHGFDDGFVAVNLSQYPESLIESELFGHRRGAFTGAIDDHIGVFGRCRRHGTIFLDEIGEVSVPVQIKLLRVLQEREYSRVGSHEAERFMGRMMAATNRPVETLRAEGGLRDDFFYRLSTDVIELPPLRRRIGEAPEELPDLVGSIVERTLGAPDGDTVGQVLDVIERRLPVGYGWPGNVRELEQCVRRVLVTGDYTPHTATQPDEWARLFDAMRQAGVDAAQAQAEYVRLVWKRAGTYEATGKLLGLDRRTVKKYVDESAASQDQ